MFSAFHTHTHSGESHRMHDDDVNEDSTTHNQNILLVHVLRRCKLIEEIEIHT